MKLSTSSSDRWSLLSELLIRATSSSGSALSSMHDFINRGGLQVLCSWTKDLQKQVSSVRSSDPKASFELESDFFHDMISLLDILPIDWNLLKKTKIGKAINSSLKAQLFENMESAAILVDRWKVMVKELKAQ
jgi:hypothetical protein